MSRIITAALSGKSSVGLSGAAAISDTIPGHHEALYL
jgi:hypothetical protein